MGKRVAFDIETYCPIEKIQSVDLIYLRKRRNYESDEKFLRDLSINPYVSYLISFALFCLGDKKVIVYYLSQGDDKNQEELPEGIQVFYNPINIEIDLDTAERKLLESFWEEVKEVNKVISFHGASFDIEFVRVRTMMHGLKPLNFFSFLQTEHIDLKDSLRVGGENYSLNFIARRFGIVFDKGNMDGSKVRELFAKGDYREIATYNARDVIITGLLYERIRDYIYGESIPEIPENLSPSVIIEHGINVGLINKKEASMLIDVYKRYEFAEPSEDQIKYLRILFKTSNPPIEKINACLDKGKWNQIIQSLEEEIT